VLEGISRRTVIEMAQAAALPVRVAPLPVAALRAADEVFLSSTGGGVIAVSHLDGVAVGGRSAGAFGPVTRQLQQTYWALHDDPQFAEPVSTD
jgi:branched-chain amino acid aminotransferase